MSTYLIRCFDKIHHMDCTKCDSHYMLHNVLCNPGWLIDPRLQIYLLCKWASNNNLTVGQIYDTKVSISMYYVNIDLLIYAPDELDVKRC